MKTKLNKLVAIIAIVTAPAIYMNFCGPGIPPPPEIETVYASPFILSVNNINPDPPNFLLESAETRLNIFFDDLEELMGDPYIGFDHLYCEFGVSTINCADRLNLLPISTSNGFSGAGFSHNVQFSGSIFLQYVSQCHTNPNNSNINEGVFWKGSEFHNAFDYPLVPNGNIIIDLVVVTNCTLAPAGEEYGCSFDG